jgi:hypothetical protein
MLSALAILSSPAAQFALFAALCWAPATGLPTWPALSRGRLGSTVAISLVVGAFVFLAARQAGVSAEP